MAMKSDPTTTNQPRLSRKNFSPKSIEDIVPQLVLAKISSGEKFDSSDFARPV